MSFRRRSGLRPPLFVVGCWVATWATLVALGGCSSEAKLLQHEKNANAFFAAGDYAKAELEYLNVFKLDPKNIHALRQIGVMAHEQGRIGFSLVYLQRAKELAPTDLATRLKLGLVYLSLGNRADASAEAAFVLEQRPDDAEAAQLLAEATSDDAGLSALRERLLALPAERIGSAAMQLALGILDVKQGRTADATQRFQRALELDPNLAGAHSGLGVIHSLAKSWDEADQAYKRAADLSSARSPRRLHYITFKLQRGDKAGARAALEALLKQAPDFITAKVRLAEIAVSENKPDEAQTWVRAALSAEPNHPEALLLASQLALAQHEPATAVTLTERLLRFYPRSTQALLEQARAYLALSEVSKAETTFSLILSIDPDHLPALTALASIYLRQDDRASAIALLRPWLERKAPDDIPPELVDAYALLAEALRGHGDYAETLKIYQRIERVTPGREHLSLMRGIVLQQQNKPAEARVALEEALQRNPASALAIEQLVGLDVAEKRLADARSRLDSALAAHPEEADLHLLNARLCLAEKKRTEAEAAIRRANELQANNPQGYLLLARIQLDAGEQPAALASLRAAVQRSPRNATAWLLIGSLEDKAGNLDQARAAYEKLVSIAPAWVPGLNNLAALLSLRFNELDKAYELARKARELAPGEAVVADTLGWIGFLRGDYAWAVGLLRESAGKQPKDPVVHYHLAKTLYMLGETGPAAEAFNRALAIDPAFPHAEETRERLALLEGDGGNLTAEQIAARERHLQKHPKDPVVLSQLAAAKARAGDRAAAAVLQRRAVLISPDGTRLRLALAHLLEEQGEAAEALEHARMARRLAPDNAEIGFDLGQLAYRLRDYAWSFSLLQDAARRMTPTVEQLRALAGSAFAVGRITEAKEALKALLARGPDPESQVRVQLIEAAETADAAAAAVGAARLKLASDPKDVAALWVLAMASGRTPAGLAHLEAILAIYPDFVPAKRHLVLHLYQDPSQDARTLQLGTQARELLRTDLELNRALGLVVFRSGDYRRALGLLESSTDGYPKDAELWYYVGRCYQEVKQNTPAMEALNRALTLGLRGAPAEDAKTRLAALGAPLER